jgi:hypothetical protein
MERGAVRPQKVRATDHTLQLPPWPTTGMTIDADVGAPRPTIITTGRLRAELALGVHRAAAATRRGNQRWRGGRWLGDVFLDGMCTGGTEGPCGEARKRLVVYRSLLSPLSGFATGVAIAPSRAGPRPKPDHAQPQQPQERELVEKQVVYYGVFPSIWENDDRPPVSQAAGLSAG